MLIETHIYTYIYICYKISRNNRERFITRRKQGSRGRILPIIYRKLYVSIEKPEICNVVSSHTYETHTQYQDIILLVTCITI